MTASYFDSYQNLAMERTESGILTVRLHTDGGPIVFTGQTHHDLPRAVAEIGDDRENKVVILTGTGDVFMDEIDGASLGEIFKPAEWDKIYWEGRRVLQRLLEIEAPIIAAVNGPATVHSEYVLLADITVASSPTRNGARGRSCAQPERDAERVTLRAGETFDELQDRPTELTQRRVVELHLALDARS